MRDGANVFIGAGSQVLLNSPGGIQRGIRVGSSPGVSTVDVDGIGTLVDIVGRVDLRGAGRLTVSNGAQVTHNGLNASLFNSFLIGTGGTGELVVDSGAMLQSVVPLLRLGTDSISGPGQGFMDIMNGSVVDVTAQLSIGSSGSTAAVTVQNSTLTVREDPNFLGFFSGSIFVGDGEPDTVASLTLTDGAVANVDNNVYAGFALNNPGNAPAQLSVCESTLNADEVLIGPAATLSGSTINANLTVYGTVEPGCSPGVLTVNGDVTFLGGELIIELAGPGNVDVLQVSGTTEIQSGTAITLSFQNGYAPSAGDNIDFIDSTQLVLPPDPTTVSYEVEGLLDGFEFDVSTDGEGLNLMANTDGAPVSVDPSIRIRPWIDPNYVYPGSFLPIKVAILTTNDAPIFDATTVDPQSVRFGPDGASAILRRTRYWDVDGDGDMDILLAFRIRDTGIACGDTSAELTGQTQSGTAISASDSIQTIFCH